ncbi:hypothetical protein [Spongiactinospora sp. TRM90649]|uniref:hypothetical protein n=1 Tax=Spongiactinospora sp. TRM90649 TaxID=3031114 RepID=UPI0023FA4312|nr:hypothetical protein [Spongiactinospora sp. TRM90649]MDF5758233.1 hypothetical protein [Spongiactinospora sp. TRM90649]
MTWWTAVRFAHVLSAMLWVGGQLTVSLVVLPPARRLLDERGRRRVLDAVGRRFGLLTVAALLPVQLATGVALAWHNGVTWAALAGPGYGRLLAIKMALFCAVMVAAALHGWATGAGRAGFARGMAVASLAGSVGVVLVATALPGS